MRNLLQLLVRFGGLIMFLLLEGISFFLIVQYNQTQNQIFFSSANAAVGAVYEWFSGARDYFHLDDQNRQLLADNQRLLAENQRLHKILEKRENTARDTLTPASVPKDSVPQPFVYIGAKVINNSITVNSNYLTLDKGTNEGVVKNSGVINANGIVGVVRSVSGNYASVISILHRQTRISASIKHKGFFGTLVWDGSDPLHMRLEAIPKHADLFKGDTVITSGYSYLFPRGIMVGKIDSMWREPGDNFHSIRVKLANDMSRLEYAYICVNKDRPKLLELERTEEDE